MQVAYQGLPSVSVVIPTVNRPEMLARAIRSVLDQRYDGCIECIVVFDHVEPTIADERVSANRSVRVAVNTRRQGLAGNRNTGYLLATGDLVCPCDDDDEWLPDKVAAQVALLREHPDAVVAGCGFFVSVAGKDTERTASAAPLTFADLLRGRHMEVNSSTYMVRRTDLLDRVGLIDEDLPGGYGEDYEWALRATRLGPAVCVTRPLVRIHWHERSYFSSGWRTVVDALTYLLAHVPEFADQPAGLARIEGQIALAQAALGDRTGGASRAFTALRRDLRARQAWGALIVATGLMTPATLVSLGRRLGHGV
jgi:glycosyltransferase involved in cell wall biosynthesis